ncbi:ChbG/HpnK family deacetylase [Azospirillum griseum]|uniref:ChbG/HpnK family deacetylase n=1 Tax=Azospirillum griseum TaxID=2496639 RepID=A0A3S0I2U6_9PROT|nr:ChbG/HpnK family deacetylase [Azospirillum griseum]RTR22534.1 ChbG/HpnK family deacetylase [Azospirillum griseum]
MTVPVVICADDYGLAPGVNLAIRELIALGRITATSVMSLCPHWEAEAAALRAVAGHADVGLHFTLTDQRPLGPMPHLAPDGRLPSLGRLMAMAYRQALDAAEIRAELTRQIDAFTAVWGRPPAYIDGHQHVHQLPTVRDAVVDAAAAWPGTYVRRCGEPIAAVLARRVAVPKTLLIGGLGFGLSRRLDARSIPANDRFAGVYDFATAEPFAALMPRFLAGFRHGKAGRNLMMVHPGLPDEALRRVDSLVEPRRAEYEYLKGADFAALLERQGIRPVRFQDLPSIS